jgi:hypothetical protein
VGGDPTAVVLLAGLEEVVTDIGEGLRRAEEGGGGLLVVSTRGEVLPLLTAAAPAVVGLVKALGELPATTWAYVPVGLLRPTGCGDETPPRPDPDGLLLLLLAGMGRMGEGEVLPPRPGTAGSPTSLAPDPGLAATADTSLSSPKPPWFGLLSTCACCLCCRVYASGEGRRPSRCGGGCGGARSGKSDGVVRLASGVMRSSPHTSLQKRVRKNTSTTMTLCAALPSIQLKVSVLPCRLQPPPHLPVTAGRHGLVVSTADTRPGRVDGLGHHVAAMLNVGTL